MDDLKILLSGGIGTKNEPSMQDIAMKMRRMQPTENDVTDTETLNSRLSYSSGNSEDALLPGHNRTSSIHLVNPRRVGILKRFLPFMSTEESQSSDSTQTVDTHLCEMSPTPRPNYHNIRRKSLQPEMLRNQQDDHSSLHSYTGNLMGTGRRSHCLHEAYSYRHPDVKFMRPPRCGVTFEDEHYHDSCYDDEFYSNPYFNYRSMNPRKSPMASMLRMPAQPDNVWNTPINMPMNGEPQMKMGFSQPSQIVQQIPVPMVVNPRQAINHTTIPGVPVTVPNVTTNLPQNQATEDSILQQLHDALTGTLNSKPTNPSPSEDSKETKKEDNSLEAHFSRIHAIMAEKKKRAAENQPFQIARVMGLVANILLLLCVGGIVGIGISNMINKDSAIYTGVTKSSQSDQSFQYFCYVFCLIGGILVGILVCGFCGSIKTKQVLFDSCWCDSDDTDWTLGFSLPREFNICTDVFFNIKYYKLFQIESTVIKQLRDAIVNQYMDGSMVATAWDTIQVMGCIEVLKEWYHSISILTLSAVGVLVVMEILCIVFAARLFKKTNEKKEREKKKKKEALEKEKAEKELASK